MNMKIVCMGDSLTEGYQIDLSKRWTSVLQKRLNIEIINSGISGDTTGGMLARFKEMVIDHKPSHVIIMGGTNDMFAGVTVEIVKSNILAMTRYARYHGIMAIIGIPTPYCLERLSPAQQIGSELSRAKRIDHMRSELRQYFIEDGLPVIEIGQGLVAEDYLSDALHPNEIGHHKMMENIKVLIERIIDENTTHR
jgi:lysophospholipase L1-like esterase